MSCVKAPFCEIVAWNIQCTVVYAITIALEKQEVNSLKVVFWAFFSTKWRKNTQQMVDSGKIQGKSHKLTTC